MAGNSIRIPTKLNTDGIKASLAELKKEAQNIAKETNAQVSDINKNLARLNAELDKAKTKQKELLDQQQELADKKEKLRQRINELEKDGSTSADRSLLKKYRQEYSEVSGQLDNVNKMLAENDATQNSLNGQIEQQNALVDELTSKESEKLSKIEKEKEELLEQLKILESQNQKQKDYSNGMKKILASAKRIGLAMIGVRGIYTVISRAVGTITQDNEKLKNTMTAMWTGLGTLIEPVVNGMIQGLGKVLSYAFAVIKQLTGIDLLSKTLSRMKKNAGGNSGNLASFDKSEVLNKNGGNDPTNTYLKNVEIMGKVGEAIAKLKSILEPLFQFIGSAWEYIYTNVLQPLGKWFEDTAIPVALDVIGGIIAFILSVMQTLAPILQYAYENFWEPMAGAIGEELVFIFETFANLFYLFATYFADWYQKILDNPDLLQTLGTILGIIGDVLLIIVGAFIAWKALQLVSSLFNPITLALMAIGLMIEAVIYNWDEWGDTITYVINHGLTAVEKFANHFIDAWNKIKEAVNSLAFDLPEWLGGGHVGFNLPMSSHISLPRVGTPTKPGLKGSSIPKGAVPLAKGAVLQPNKPFMAMLGDQRNGRNLEAPEELIRSIVREESGGALTLNITADSTASEFVRWLKLELSKEDKRSGASLVG